MAPQVFLLDDDEDLRGIFIELFATCFDLECIAASSVADLIAMRDRALVCNLAILDVNLGHRGPSGLDAYRWLREQGFDGTIVFLTGHAASHPMVVRASRLSNVRVLEKPISMASLTALIEELRA